MTVYKNVQVTSECPECKGFGPQNVLAKFCHSCNASGRVPVPTSDLPAVLASLVPGAETIEVGRYPGSRTWFVPTGQEVSIDYSEASAVVFPEPKESEAERREQILTELTQDAQDLGGYDDVPAVPESGEDR